MKKKNFLLAILFTIIAPISLNAQFARLDKYPQIPTHYDATFVDYVKDFASGSPAASALIIQTRMESSTVSIVSVISFSA